MKKFLQILLTVGCTIASTLVPNLAAAQGGGGGGRGGFGGGGGRGGRGGRNPGDSSATSAPRPALSFADMVFAKRSEIQLTDSQLVKLNDIRMTAASRRVMLTREVDSVKTEMGTMPDDAGVPSVPATDSSRKVLIGQRRALANVLGDLHDVDVNARKETLAMLNPLQQKKAELLQEIVDTPPNPKAEGGRTGKEGRAAGGRPGGGAGVP
ncbi:MAG: hypothetical protein ABI035_08555 [Gemmatimonadaceae bacterium]